MTIVALNNSALTLKNNSNRGWNRRLLIAMKVPLAP
jgi:hypothetical protein